MNRSRNTRELLHVSNNKIHCECFRIADYANYTVVKSVIRETVVEHMLFAQLCFMV